MLCKKEVITVRETVITRTIRTYSDKDDGPGPAGRKGQSPSRTALEVSNHNTHTKRNISLVGR